MIDFYYWPTPNGWKIAIALEEMNLPYTTQLVNIGKGEQFNPNFLKISPNNRMPAIVDHDGPDGAPLALFESGAILQYLARKTGTFYGTTYRDQLAVDQWLMWQMGGLGPMAGQNHHFNKYAPLMGEDLTYAKDRYTQETARLYRVLNTQLEQNDYVAGDFFSIAVWRSGPGRPYGRAKNRHSRINRIWPAGCKPAPRAAALLLAMGCIWTCG